MKVSVKYNTMIVKDMEESIAFYKDALGFSVGYQVDFGEGQGITLMNSPDGGTVELIKQNNLPVGLWSVGTDVDNLEEVLEHLKEQGITEHTPVVKTTVGRMCFVTDPNGVKVCLIEHDEKFKGI